MNEIEYLFGLILLLFGFNIGYYEASKGLTFDDFKKIVKFVFSKFKKLRK